METFLCQNAPRMRWYHPGLAKDAVKSSPTVLAMAPVHNSPAPALRAEYEMYLGVSEDTEDVSAPT